MKKLLQLSIAILFGALFFVGNCMASTCDYWYTKVGVDDVEFVGEAPDLAHDEEILSGIECLLKLEDDTSEGAFWGATSFEVSQILPKAGVNVCALYYISYLFEENWKHALGVVLIDRAGNKNEPSSVSKAFASYRKWFDRVKEIGLKKARERSLDPLENSGISWYGSG
ncbi:MAG: hypothetical protein IPM63_04800 [Acidobacteriota bacterium]|nr:MAG: hypothetical protein IPM63_04800 [Acidobacteriota bacterium]